MDEKATLASLAEIETACQEIVELLKLGRCQKFQVLTEVEIILENVKNLKENEK